MERDGFEPDSFNEEQYQRLRSEADVYLTKRQSDLKLTPEAYESHGEQITWFMIWAENGLMTAPKGDVIAVNRASYGNTRTVVLSQKQIDAVTHDIVITENEDHATEICEFFMLD